MHLPKLFASTPHTQRSTDQQSASGCTTRNPSTTRTRRLPSELSASPTAVSPENAVSVNCCPVWLKLCVPPSVRQWLAAPQPLRARHVHSICSRKLVLRVVTFGLSQRTLRLRGLPMEPGTARHIHGLHRDTIRGRQLGGRTYILSRMTCARIADACSSLRSRFSRACASLFSSFSQNRCHGGVHTTFRQTHGMELPRQATYP